MHKIVLESHLAFLEQCVYSPWSPPISEDLMCYRTSNSSIINVRYSQIREVLVDSNYGLPTCDQDDLYREVVISSPDLVRACLDPPRGKLFFFSSFGSCQNSKKGKWFSC